jgi:hypothetical protein
MLKTVAWIQPRGLTYKPSKIERIERRNWPSIHPYYGPNVWPYVVDIAELRKYLDMVPNLQQIMKKNAVLKILYQVRFPPMVCKKFERNVFGFYPVFYGGPYAIHVIFLEWKDYVNFLLLLYIFRKSVFLCGQMYPLLWLFWY